ncbi:tRNA (adenosine(37)-N6)-threonylcarbamoyltransferase complex dimerization subunit type 1 TsaB [Mucilaginibacter boryungensis]|uniref:tRNA (Adenosine(37)-N6)-threonylcarbamoyltransferase complex dimerization subunit type 1 TsaB n=1 Tax=Mucilaginibacter boryungensis TaxID=768480 RepID=A0ABR9XKJ4_9SPHI|nr:tRNA (adenosine(37)-N6)-threonylcarbamoyltransferase complex dimerization subunit type 1 TsaB [Mucilaginibacter boryungensis]MBE9667760.1 tRNA (adenosine(37)-N6)-threonylcarbamoyltransferase complex dimerization subunit type 1 TsaB [Mucilaginibacter boryungensis]
MILQIETATTSCSVALTQDGQVLAKKELNQRNVHAEVLTLFIEGVFKHADKQYADLDAIAVSSGPGSYTGLRIGVSTAKGLCYALDKPLIAVETLKAMADGMISRLTLTPESLLCPMIDARRMEVFTAIFDINGNKITPTSAEIIDQSSFADLLNDHKIYFFGDGAAKCRETLTHPNAIFIDGYENSANDLTFAALKKFNSKDFEDVAYFEPYYLKEFIAGVKKIV